jgi:hypothetical protein
MPSSTSFASVFLFLFAFSILLPVLLYSALCAIWSPFFGGIACVLALFFTVATAIIGTRGDKSDGAKRLHDW